MRRTARARGGARGRGARRVHLLFAPRTETHMIEGSCLCKGIRFRIVGRHSEISMCHCSLCRKTTGGGAASEITVDGNGFVWLAGQELVAEGPKHAFCRICGCHAPYGPANGNMNVPVGALDAAPAIAVGRHIYIDSKAAWDMIGDDGALRYPENGDPLPLNRADL